MTFSVMKASNHPIYICFKLNRMCKAYIVLKDYLTEKKGEDKNKLKAATDITELLKKIDNNAEKVPENSLEMFTRFLISLKGKPLNKAEEELLKEIVLYKKNIGNMPKRKSK